MQTCPSCTGSNEPPKIHSFTVIHQKSESFRSLVRQKPADGNAHHPFLQRQAAEAGNKIRQAAVIALRLGNPLMAAIHIRIVMQLHMKMGRIHTAVRADSAHLGAAQHQLPQTTLISFKWE